MRKINTQMTSSNKLQLKNISISFSGTNVLDSIGFDVKDGEFVAIVGPSGCGKSTLLNILAGILPFDSGEIIVDGTEVHGLSSHFAYMPQSDLLLPWYTILDNVTLYGKIHHNVKSAKEKALKEFATFGLQGYENAYPNELSGGMRQRAAFLRTALCDADILLLDEPFGALDVITRHEMQDWLLNLRSSFQKTTILVTHDMDEALYLADRIIILGKKPSRILREINLHDEKKSREWLFEQKDLQKQMYTILKENSHA